MGLAIIASSALRSWNRSEEGNFKLMRKELNELSETSDFLLNSAQTYSFPQNQFFFLILQKEGKTEGIINTNGQSCAEELMERQWQEKQGNNSFLLCMKRKGFKTSS